MLLYWYNFVVLGDTFVCVRNGIPILGLGFHKGVFSGTAHCVKGSWDPNSAFIPVGTDSYRRIPHYYLNLQSGISDDEISGWWTQDYLFNRVFNTDLHFPGVLCYFAVLLCLDFEPLIKVQLQCLYHEDK